MNHFKELVITLVTTVFQYGTLVFAVVGGVGLSIAMDETHNGKKVILRMAAGLFCALVFTESIIDIAGRNPEIWRTPISAFLAMSGYAITRIISNLSVEKTVELLRAWRSGK